MTAAAKTVVSAAALCVKSEGARDKFVPAARDVSAATKSLVAVCEAFSTKATAPENGMIKDRSGGGVWAGALLVDSLRLRSANTVRHAVVELVRGGKALMLDPANADAKNKLQTSGASVARGVKSLLELVNNAILDDNDDSSSLEVHDLS